MVENLKNNLEKCPPHHWLIESPDKNPEIEFLPAECKKCHTTRTYYLDCNDRLGNEINPDIRTNMLWDRVLVDNQ